MAVRNNNTVNSIENDAHNARTNMMNMWRDSMERTRQARQTTEAVAKKDPKAELEQKIRNGQVECPTCARRQFQDQSNDGGVSFQAARSMPSATAGVTVAAHEGEHVSANASEENGEVETNSTVALEYARCPECGRTYVAGGVTKTTTRPASLNKNNGGFSLSV